MNTTLQFNIVFSSKLGEESFSYTDPAKLTEASIDFAALLMAMMVPQVVNSQLAATEQMGEEQMLLTANPISAKNIQDLGQGQVPENPEPLLLNFDSKPFAQVLDQGLAENLNSQEAAKPVADFESNNFRPLDLKSLDVKSQHTKIQENIKVDNEEQTELIQAKDFTGTKFMKQYVQTTQTEQELNEEQKAVLDGNPLQPSLIEDSYLPEKEIVPVRNFQAIVHQMVEKSKITIAQGKSQVEIQLKPEHLGKVHMQIALEEGILTAKFAVESLAVGRMLETNLTLLKDTMQNQGLKFSQVSIEVGNGGPGQNPGGFFSNSGGQFASFSPKRKLESTGEEVGRESHVLGGVNYLA